MYFHWDSLCIFISVFGFYRFFCLVCIRRHRDIDELFCNSAVALASLEGVEARVIGLQLVLVSLLFGRHEFVFGRVVLQILHREHARRACSFGSRVRPPNHEVELVRRICAAQATFFRLYVNVVPSSKRLIIRIFLRWHHEFGVEEAAVDRSLHLRVHQGASLGRVQAARRVHEGFGGGPLSYVANVPPATGSSSRLTLHGLQVPLHRSEVIDNLSTLILNGRPAVVGDRFVPHYSQLVRIFIDADV